MDQQNGKKVSDEVLVAAAAEAANVRQLLLAVGLVPQGGNYASVRRRLAALGVDTGRFDRPAVPRVRRDDLEAAVEVSSSFAEVAQRLELGTSAGAVRRARRLVAAAGLDRHRLAGTRARGLPNGRGRPLSAVLVHGRFEKSTPLRLRLLSAGLLEACCATRGLRQWRGRPVPLELDHVNGDRLDHRLENLRLLCPNCHAQTETYRGRNVGHRSASRTVLSAPP